MRDILGMWPVNLERDERRRAFHYEERRVINLMDTGKEVRGSNGREKR